MQFSEHNWAKISETIFPEMLIFGKFFCLFCPSLKMSLIRVQLWWREVKYIIYSSRHELKCFCMLLQKLIKELLWSNLHTSAVF